MSKTPSRKKAEKPGPNAPKAQSTPETPQAASPASETPTQARAIAPSQRPLTKVTELPPFRVILHDDESTEMTFVVRSIVELTPLSAPVARDVMLSAHEHGFAQVLVTHQERAELYQEQFASKGLTVTIEAAG